MSDPPGGAPYPDTQQPSDLRKQTRAADTAADTPDTAAELGAWAVPDSWPYGWKTGGQTGLPDRQQMAPGPGVNSYLLPTQTSPGAGPGRVRS